MHRLAAWLTPRGQCASFLPSSIHFPHEPAEDFSHWNATSSLGRWLQESGIPALHGVDTRELTKGLREEGSTLGKIVFPKMDVPYSDPNRRNLVAEVSCKEPMVFNKGASPKIVAFDCGIKYNIIRYIARKGVELTGESVLGNRGMATDAFVAPARRMLRVA